MLLEPVDPNEKFRSRRRQARMRRAYRRIGLLAVVAVMAAGVTLGARVLSEPGTKPPTAAGNQKSAAAPAPKPKPKPQRTPLNSVGRGVGCGFGFGAGAAVLRFPAAVGGFVPGSERNRAPSVTPAAMTATTARSPMRR
jgi:hypothetical protein